MIESDSITPFELEDIMAHEMNNMLRSLTIKKGVGQTWPSELF